MFTLKAWVGGGRDQYFLGLVAAIPGAKFVDNQYSFGLMAYPQSAGGDRFMVVNYWVQ